MNETTKTEYAVRTSDNAYLVNDRIGPGESLGRWGDLDGAMRFNTPSAALAAVQRSAKLYNRIVPDMQIVRLVEREKTITETVVEEVA
jgi:hypothetical protein